MNRFLHSRKRKIYVMILAAVILMPSVTFAANWALDIGLAIFSIFARLAGMAGVALNLAVNHLVIDFGAKMQFGFGASVENAWSIIRDVINICFIFGLVYIGFKVILDNASQARKLLPPLIIAALLINFSLFFTKVIIDVTNIAAVEIFEKGLSQDAVGRPPGETLTDAEEAENAANIGISGAYMQILGLKALISPNRNQPQDEENFLKLLGSACTGDASTVKEEFLVNCTSDIFVYFMVASIFMLVATYAFLAGAFLIVVRFVTLIILMILSPLMFLNMALPLPGTNNISRQWWSSFLSSAFMAPAYFLFLYIGLAVGSKTQLGDINMFQATQGEFTAMTGVLNLIIVAAFMLFAVTTARKMAKSGSSVTLSMADNARRRGQRLLMAGAAGGAAYAGRQTIGKGAQNMSENKRRIELAQGKGLRAWYNRQMLSGAKNVAGKSFDARNSATVRGGVGMLGGDAKKELGEGKKGGYAQKLKDVKKREEGLAELYGGNDDAVYADYGVEERHKKYKATGKEIGKLQEEIATATNKQERIRKTRELGELLGKQKAMEKGQWLEDGYNGTYQQFVEYNRQNNIDSSVTEDQFNSNKQRYAEAARRFSEAKKAEKGYGARRYATNRETAWTESKAHKLVGWIFTDSQARKEGAKAVKKKNAQKGTDQKLKDVIKELNEGGGAAPAAPAAPAPGGGSSTT